MPCEQCQPGVWECGHPGEDLCGPGGGVDPLGRCSYGRCCVDVYCYKGEKGIVVRLESCSDRRPVPSDRLNCLRPNQAPPDDSLYLGSQDVGECTWEIYTSSKDADDAVVFLKARR